MNACSCLILALNIDNLHNELLTVKDQWQRIGERLKIPGEHLEQFKGLTEPLLEVIVHWMKGERDTPPSWSTLEDVLRDPGIDKSELADKVHRLHCASQPEEKSRNAEDFSGKRNKSFLATL